MKVFRFLSIPFLVVFLSCCHTLKVTTQGQGSVEPPGGTYLHGTRVDLTATPAAGWRFMKWNDDLISTSIEEIIIMNSDKNVTAIFGQLCTLTVATEGQGSVTVDPAGGTYDCGTEVTLIASADPGWRFSRWSGFVSGTNDRIMIMMNSDKSVTAHFVQE
jgi:hypothetical protein